MVGMLAARRDQGHNLGGANCGRDRLLVEESMSHTSCVLLFMQGVLEQLDVAVAELAPSAPLDTLGGGDEPVASTHYTASPVAPSRDGQGCTLQ